MINKCNSNPNNRVRLSSKINRNSSQAMIKKSEISSRVGTPRQDNELSKIRRTSFWMKKVIGGYVNQTKPMNQVLPNRSRKVLSMKVKTETSEAEDEPKQQNISNLKDLNSKFSLLLKYQQEIMEEVRLVGQQKGVKQNYCEKIQSLLNKVFKMVQKSSLMEKLPSLHKIIENQVEATNLLFTKTKEYVSSFIERTKSNELIVKNLQLEKENNKLMTKCHFLEEDIKRVRSSKMQVMREEDIEVVSIHQIDFQKLYDEICENNEPKLMSIEGTNRLCQKILQKSLIGVDNTSIEVINSEAVRHLTENEGLGGLKKLLEYPMLKNKTLSFNNENQLRTQTLLQVVMLEIINGKVNQNFLMASVRGNKMMKQKLKIESKRDFSLSQLLALISKFTIIDCPQKKVEILCSLISSIRQTNNDQYIEKQILESIKESEILSPLEYDKENAEKSNRISKMKNKRLINCMSLFEGKGKENRVEKNVVNVEQNLETRAKKFNKIYIKQIDCILCVYCFIRQQFQWAYKTILTNFAIYEKSMSFSEFYSILKQKLKYQFCDEFIKNRQKIESIMSLFDMLRRKRKNRVMEDDVRQNVIQQVIKGCEQKVMGHLLHKIQ